MLELYHNYTSVCAAKVRFALEEKGLEWTGRYVDIFSGEQHKPEYLKLNPLGVVPTLVCDGDPDPIIESNIINEYLDDAYPQIPVRPADAGARAHMRLWTKQLDDSVHNATGVVSYSIAYRFLQLSKPREEVEKILQGIPSPERRERNRDLIYKGIDSRFFVGALKRFERLLADLEETLSQKTWLAGKEFSLADIGYAPYLTRLERLQLTPMWDKRPKTADWFNRIKSRGAYQRAIADCYNKAPTHKKLLEEKGTEFWPRVKTILQQN
jgi:glutathione S-transferase